MSQALSVKMPCRPYRTAVTAIGLISLAGCATNPVTGERQLVLVSEAQEIQLGRQGVQQVEQTIGYVDNDALQAYVQRLGAQLAAAAERPDLPWTFRVVDDPTPNAFALPGGFIFFTRGMMNLMDSEAELITVLGHEIGHVTARHSVTQLTRGQLANLGLGVGGILFPELQPFGQVASAGLDLLFLKYGRGAERQADDLAFRYALEAGYDVGEADDIFLSLQRMGELEERSALPTWLSTHPAPEERVERFRQRQAELGARQDEPRLGRAEYLGMIDGLVYGENPRNGFFREGVFYHPDLRFRFAVPAQWQTQNLARAVLALSPQRDASVQLTLTADAEPAVALRQFLAQQGIQAGQARQQTINGIPAAIGSFQAQTQQGVIRGLVAYLRYGGATYQLVSYTPAAQYAQYDRLFQQIIGSFGPLTDPQILAVQPNRIDIVRLDRNLSLGEFNRIYPSVIPIERLALLNQVPNQDAALAAGTLVKRVVSGRATP
jgi:predicted Zn-dependent protease